MAGGSTYQKLKAAIVAAATKKPFTISGAALGSIAITTLLDTFLGTDALTVTLGGQPIDTGRSITVSGSMTASVFGPARLAASAEFTISDDTAEVLISAGWTVGQGTSTLTLGTLLGKLNISPAALPESIDLIVQQAAFIYDSAAGVFLIAAKTESYGEVNFVARVASDKFPALYAIGLQSGQQVGLTDLPLIGDKLQDLASIDVDGLQIFAANQALAVAGPTANALLKTYGANFPAGFASLSFPDLPETATTTAAFTANFNIGTLTKPLMLPLDGGTVQGRNASAGRQVLTAVASTPAASGTIWFPVQQTFGPVSFQRIGVQYTPASQTIWFELDASLAVGPLTLTLTGLAVGAAVSDFATSLTLAGIAVDYANAPLQIAGSLINLDAGGSSLSFEGGLVISTGDFTIDAVGYYGNESGFPSMFVFGELAEALGGPPAFFITGVAAGFGYNSNVTLPGIADVGSFPLVAALTNGSPNFNAGSSAVEVLETLVTSNPPWVNAQGNSIWLAAGVTFTSFKLVDSQALLVAEAGNDLVISLLGQSKAQFPQAGTGQKTYAIVEMDLDAKFQPALGAFSVQAALSPSSFVFDPACLLTGGFAFFVWSGDNPYAGDFVLSLGGYNPSFAPPSYYPQIPRLQFHWSLDGSVAIQGDAYFALTPSMLMFGGGLSVTYQSGNLKAWLTANADVLIGWVPFQYDISISISLGASYKLDLLFTSMTVSVELGCTLELMGPPTHGLVHVDWWAISFTIRFGDWDQTKVTATWSDVQAVLPNTGTAEKPNVVLIQATDGLTNTGSAGGATARLKAISGDETSAWTVRGGSFGFVTSSHVPATSYAAGDNTGDLGTQFHVAPLGWSGIVASHVVEIRNAEDPDGHDYSNGFTVSPINRNVPASLWGDLPASQIPDADNQLVAGQISGLQFVVKPPGAITSFGAIDQDNLQADPLNLGGAVMPLSAAAEPAGDIAVLDAGSIGKISNPATGIGSDPAMAQRASIVAALRALNFDAPTNDGLTAFAASIASGALADAPLSVGSLHAA